MRQLVINGPGYFDTACNLQEGVTSLGRGDDNDIVLSGDLVSRKHVCILREKDSVFVDHLDSRNGSRLNEEDFRGRVSLKMGDVLQIGENALTVRQLHQSERASTEMVVLSNDSPTAVRPERDSAVVVLRNVRDSVLLRALDNVGRVSSMPGPFNQSRASIQPVDCDSLLLL